jgi:hypothetical protein
MSHKARVNITFEDSEIVLLTQLAEQEHRSLTHIAKELVLEALERREDKLLSVIAEKRDIKNAKRITHDDAWE